jgi:hypothetical protein
MNLNKVTVVAKMIRAKTYERIKFNASSAIPEKALYVLYAQAY